MSIVFLFLGFIKDMPLMQPIDYHPSVLEVLNKHRLFHKLSGPAQVVLSIEILENDIYFPKSLFTPALLATSKETERDFVPREKGPEAPPKTRTRTNFPNSGKLPSKKCIKMGFSYFIGFAVLSDTSNPLLPVPWS